MQEFWRLRGFPPGSRSLSSRVPFPTEPSESGGGMVSCQKDPGILCVSCEYSEDSVRREAGTLKPLWGSQPPTRGARLADTDTLSWLQGREPCPRSPLHQRCTRYMSMLFWPSVSVTETSAPCCEPDVNHSVTLRLSIKTSRREAKLGLIVLTSLIHCGLMSVHQQHILKSWG